jgi:predicted nucleic acid-binding Zn ribbon protein
MNETELISNEITYIKPRRKSRALEMIAFGILLAILVGAMVALMYSSLGMPIK